MTTTPNKIKYIDCPECRGRGLVLIPQQGPNGYYESWQDCDFCWQDCDFCDGMASFEEVDYLAMKLAGEV